MAINHYHLLGVPPDAGERRIRSAYRSLAKRFHPDRNSGSETAAELFRQVNHAYKVLSDPQLRAHYDKKLSQQEAQAVTKKNPQLEPQQKFNRFVKSLLDALFGPADTTQKATNVRRPAKAKHLHQQVEKPEFKTHYKLAVEKKRAPYTRGSDGVFRKSHPSQQHR